MQVWSLGWEDPLEKSMTTHSSILAWRITWTEAGRLQFIGLHRVRHDWSDLAHRHTAQECNIFFFVKEVLWMNKWSSTDLNWIGGGKQGFPWLKLCPNSSNQFHKYAKLIIKKSKVKLLVAQSCPTLCYPMDVANQVSLFRGFSRQEYRSELPFPSPGDLLNPGIKPGSIALWAKSLLLSYQGSQ